MGSDGALDTYISERKALGWMNAALSDESSVIGAFHETIESGTDRDRSPGLTYMIVRCVDEHAGSSLDKDALMARLRSMGNLQGSWTNNRAFYQLLSRLTMLAPKDTLHKGKVPAMRYNMR